jgi:pyruvate/2-oxoglutarate/acetoin dehydrogenase E1 component
MGMGIGAAMTGLRPIVEGMNMGFLLLAFNQVSSSSSSSTSSRLLLGKQAEGLAVFAQHGQQCWSHAQEKATAAAAWI